MPSNVEIKARVTDLATLEQRAKVLSGSPPQTIEQHDTFFRVGEGRLKLRRFAADRGELIFYRRPDDAGPKQSQYSIVPTDRPDELAALLSASLGVLGVVRKHRRLYLVGQTRVHLDRVEGLGDFVELEVVLRSDQAVDEGQKIAEGLMEQLGISQRDLVSGAYLDLLRAEWSAVRTLRR